MKVHLRCFILKLRDANIPAWFQSKSLVYHINEHKPLAQLQASNESLSIASMSNLMAFAFSCSSITVDLLLVESVSEDYCWITEWHSSVATVMKHASLDVWPIDERVSFGNLVVKGSYSSSIPISFEKLRSRSSPSGWFLLSSRISKAVILKAWACAI